LQREKLAPLSPSLLLPLKNIEGKSVYSYSLSPSLPPPSFIRKHTKKVYRGSTPRERTERRKHTEGRKHIEGRKVEVE
jgi:hypothetical protein